MLLRACFPCEPGETLSVARVISVGQDRHTGEAILGLRDTEDRGAALGLAKGMSGLAEARDELDGLQPDRETGRSRLGRNTEPKLIH